MNRDEVEKVVRSLLEVIWEKHEYDKLNQFYHLELEGYYNDDKVDYGQLEKKVQIFQEHTSGMKIEVLDLLVEDNSFALHVFQHLEKEGKKASIQSILIGYLKEGKIHKYFLKTEMPLEFN